MAAKPRRSVLIAARTLTALVSLAGAEGMLWFMGYPNWWGLDPTWGGATPEYECDADLGWKPREGHFNLVWSDGSSPFPFEYTNWSNGRRATSEHEIADQRPRVLFFGDSYVQGYGLSDRDTLPWIFQQRHPDVAVTNFGSGAYGAYQSYLSIERSLHGPARVYYMLNKFQEGRAAADPTFIRVMKKPPQGCFYPYADLSRGQIQPRRSAGEVVWWLSRHLRTVAMVQDYKLILQSHQRVQRSRPLTEALLEKMDQAVRAQGGKFTVILFDLIPEQHADYLAFLASRHIDYVDCDTAEFDQKELRLPDGHPNGRMNRILAERIDRIEATSSRR